MGGKLSKKNDVRGSTGLPNVLRAIIASYISDLELDNWIDRSKLTFVPLCDRESGLAEYKSIKRLEPKIQMSMRSRYPWTLRCIEMKKHSRVAWETISCDPIAVPLLKANPEWVFIPGLEFNIGIYIMVPKAAIVALL